MDLNWYQIKTTQRRFEQEFYSRIVKWLCRYTRSEDYGFEVNLGDYKGRSEGAEGCVFESGGGEGVVLLLVSSRGLVCCFSPSVSQVLYGVYV